jgi:MFS family permease
MLAYVLIQTLLPSSWRRPPPGAVHLPSSALVVAAMLLLAIGCSSVREPALGYACVAAGLVLTMVFLLSQRRLREPLLNVEVLMRNTVLRNALVVQLLLYTNAFCSVFMLSIYMQVVLDETARTAGQVIALGSLLMAAIAPLAGALADRYRAHVLASFGVALAFVSALLALALDARAAWIHVALLLSVQGVGFAFFSTPNVTIIMNSVPAERRSIASALTALARTLGMMLGMLMTAAVVSLYIGDAPVGSNPELFLRTMKTSFVVLAAVSLVALAISLAASRAR